MNPPVYRSVEKGQLTMPFLKYSLLDMYMCGCLTFNVDMSNWQSDRA